MADAIVAEKPCASCKQTKPLSDFHRDSRAKTGLVSHCKPCKLSRLKKTYPQRKGRATQVNNAWAATRAGQDSLYQRMQRQQARREIKARAGTGYVPARVLSLDEYDEMAREQNDRCAICGEEPKRGRMAIDHCHATGEIRALLCHACNFGLGHFRDRTDLLLKAHRYLLAHTI